MTLSYYFVYSIIKYVKIKGLKVIIYTDDGAWTDVSKSLTFDSEYVPRKLEMGINYAS